MTPADAQHEGDAAFSRLTEYCWKNCPVDGPHEAGCYDIREIAIRAALRERDAEHEVALKKDRADALDAAARQADAVAEREAAHASAAAARAEKNNSFGDALVGHDCRGAQRGAQEIAQRIRALLEEAGK